jgi:hypothetical protein
MNITALTQRVVVAGVLVVAGVRQASASEILFDFNDGGQSFSVNAPDTAKVVSPAHLTGSISLGGTTGTMYGGYVGGFSAVGASILTIYYGQVGSIATTDSSTLNLYSAQAIDGQFGKFTVSVNLDTITYIHGGAIGDLVTNGGTTTIYGSDFKYNGVPVGYGVLPHTTNTFDRLTGTLENGDTLNTVLDRYSSIYQSGATIILSPAAVPLPSTATAGGAAMLMLAVARKRRWA